MKYKLSENILLGNILIKKGSILSILSGTQQAKKLLDAKEFMDIKKLDKTPNNKFVDWMAVKYKKEGVSLKQIENFIPEFSDAVSKNRIKGDFSTLSFEDAQKAIETKNVEKEGDYTSGLSLNVDYQLIDENKDYFVYSPLTEKGSKKLGRNTKWCTAGDYNNQFENYDRGHNAKLYYFLPKTGKDKYAVAVHPTLISNTSSYEGFDSQDKDIAVSMVLNLTGFNKSILKDWEPIEGVHYTLTGDSGKDNMIKLLLSWGLDAGNATINNDLSVDYAGDINLSEVHLTSLPFRNIQGSLSLRGHKSLTTLGNLQTVTGNLSLDMCTSLTSLGQLKSVGRHLSLDGCSSLNNLGELKSVGANMDLEGCISLGNLGVLTHVGGYLYLMDTDITLTGEDIRGRVNVGESIVR